MIDASDIRTAVKAILAESGFRFEYTFIPWSLSRDAGTKRLSLNWKVQLFRRGAGNPALTTEYGAGCAHCPSYMPGMAVNASDAIRHECEKGKAYRNTGGYKAGQAIFPDEADVIHSLLLDAEVLEFADFESWCSNFGGNTDSREEERAYKACLAIALKLRAHLGDDLMNKLREITRDL